MPEPIVGTRRNVSAAFGPGATTPGAQATAVGYRASAGTGAVAVGFTAAAITGGVAIGWSARTTNSYSAAIGYWAVSAGGFAFGSYANAGGVNSVAVGGSAASAGSYASAIGYQASANRAGTHARSSGSFAIAGDAQELTLVARKSTTDATATELAGDGTTGYFTIAASQTYAFTALVAARRTDATGESAMWEIRGCIARDSSGNCRAVGTWTGGGTPLFSDAGSAAWQVNLTADTTNNRLAITVTGEAAKTIRWVASVRMAEVRG